LSARPPEDSTVTLFSTLPILPLLVFVLWAWLPVSHRPRWVDLLPSAALALLLLDLLIDGYQALLLGLYLFSTVLFLSSLPMLRRPASARPARRGRTRLSGLIGAVAIALCVVPPTLIPIAYHSATPTGPYAVATLIYGWEDSARPETYTPDPADHRGIAVEIWYPAEARQRATDGSAPEHAAVAPAQAAYPLVIFSHGALGLRSSNTTTYRELASQGYIVASIDHTHHAFVTRFPDGDTVPISQQFLDEVQRNQSGVLSEAESEAMAFDWLDLRAADIRFALDRLAELNGGAEQGPLVRRIDLGRIGLFGHSLGGAAAAAVCREDPRCKAAAVIDGTMVGEYDRERRDGTAIADPYPRPLLLVYNGDTYHATPEHLGYGPNLYAFDHAAAPAYGVVVNGAQHLNFTDLPARAPLLARLLGAATAVGGGTVGAIDQARCMEILDRYVVAFFDQTLLGTPSSLLDGQAPFEEVEFTAHTATQ
jgi:dienelactone hydrolase